MSFDVPRAAALRLLALACAVSWSGCVGRHAARAHSWLELQPKQRSERLVRELGTDFRYLELPGARLRFIELDALLETSERPILFVHGLGGGLADFAPVMLLARGSARLVALDLPGFGGSTSSRLDYSVSGAAKTVAAFIERLGLGPVRLACHSMGGQVCLMVAMDKRELVHDLTLVAPAGLYRREDYVRETTRRFGINTGKISMHDPSRSFAAILTHGDDVVLKRLVAHDARTIAALASFRENLHERLGELHVPTLVIWGKADRVLPMSDGFALTASARRATLRLVEDAGHSAQLSDPEKVHAWMQESREP